MQLPFFIAIAAAGLLTASASVGANAVAETPLRKVITLLQEMKAQVEKEATEDEDNHAKRGCWCETNRKQKDEAVKAAEARITDLESIIEESAGLRAQLETEIPELEAGIKEDQESLATATSLRMKEASEAAVEQADAKECIAALGGALTVLSKVQLLEKSPGGPAAAAPLLAQLRQAVHVVREKKAKLARPGKFQGIMQQDLWDVLGSIETAAADAGVFLPPSPRRSLSALGRSSHVRGGALQPSGAAAGAKSYNSRSGSIVGILSQLKDDFEANLKGSEKTEMEAVVAFQHLRSSKEAEIAAGITQKKLKEKTLTETIQKAANAKNDLEVTKDSLSADQKFLVGLEKTCTESEEAYAERTKTRSDEIQALAETVKILSEDDARDLFGKTMSFVQTRSVALRGAAESEAANTAMRKIINVARKHKNWVLASLAVRVRLDGFEKVKEAMDKMVAELKKQQAAESEKKDSCNKELDETEDSLKVKGNEKNDHEGTKSNLEGTLGTLTGEMDSLRAEVADLQVSLKSAGEQRKAENALFRQSVSDQRATTNILNKALARLQSFYTTKGFLQTGQMPASKEYHKSAGAGGVLQIIQKIISDATSAEAAMVTEEQLAQEGYENLVKDAASSIDTNNVAITEKTKLAEEAKSDLSSNAAALLENAEATSKLQDLLKGMHLDCDWLVQYHEARQKARAEEMDAIAEAKAILSGANFGE